MDSNGNFISANRFGSTGHDSGYSILLDSLQNIYLSGVFNNTVDFNPGSSVDTLTANTPNVFISKYAQCLPIAPIADNPNLPNLLGDCNVTMPTLPTASHNCGTVTGQPNVNFPINNQGNTLITWTYDDGYGNISTQTQNAIITDTTSPVINLNALPDLIDECIINAPTPPTSTDNCSGSIIGIPDLVFPITTPGTTIITWTYSDGNGNITSQTQNAIITPIDSTIILSGDTLSATATGYTYQWLDCIENYTPLQGDTNQIFIPTENGNYAVQISNGICSVISNCIEYNSILGILINKNNDIFIYPNPTKGLIHFKTKKGSSNKSGE